MQRRKNRRRTANGTARLTRARLNTRTAITWPITRPTRHTMNRKSFLSIWNMEPITRSQTERIPNRSMFTAGLPKMNQETNWKPAVGRMTGARRNRMDDPMRKRTMSLSPSRPMTTSVIAGPITKTRATPEKTKHWTEEEMSAAVFRMPAKPSIAAVFRDFEDHLDSLSSEQKSAIRFYTGSDYKQFNDKLKSCPPEFNCLDSRDRATFDAIQSAIREAGPLPDTVNALFRGVGPSRKASHDALVSAIEKARDTGADFEMGFIASSSLNAKYAWDTFSTDNGYGRFFFAIKAKTGLFVDPISENKGEDEVIQAAGTRYKIVSVREDIAIKNSDGYGSKRAKMLVFLEEV